MTTYTFENSSSSQTPQPARVPWVACAIEANSEVEALVDYLHFNKESLEGTTGVEISVKNSRFLETVLRISFEGSHEYIRASAL